VTIRVRLHEVAHSRAGDKGNRCNISVIAYREEVYTHLLHQITEKTVFDLFKHKGATRVIRYELPNLNALNFVIDEVLEGGVNDGLSLDGHGKTLSSLMLGLYIEIPEELKRRAEPTDES